MKNNLPTTSSLPPGPLPTKPKTWTQSFWPLLGFRLAGNLLIFCLKYTLPFHSSSSSPTPTKSSPKPKKKKSAPRPARPPAWTKSFQRYFLRPLPLVAIGFFALALGLFFLATSQLQNLGATSALANKFRPAAPKDVPALDLPTDLNLQEATLLLDQEQLTLALQKNLQLLNFQPTHQQLLLNTALIYHQLGDQTNYQSYLQLAQTLNPNQTVFLSLPPLP